VKSLLSSTYFGQNLAVQHKQCTFSYFPQS
jgi:hypothetical protein